MPATKPPLDDPYKEDHRLMCEAVREAGAAVLKRYKNKSFEAWAKKDASPVTEADLEANDILENLLLAGDRQSYGWLSEESAEDPTRLKADRVWIVDPIDGTRSFVEGRPEFTVCVALVSNGQAQASIIFNPLTDELYEARRGFGARCNGAPLSSSQRDRIEDCKMLGAQYMFDHPGWPRPWPSMQIDYRNSTAYRMALVAEGRFDAALALIPKSDWDVAPGSLILEEAGARVTDHLGQKFVFNQKAPVQRALVCSGQGLYSDLISRLDHLPSDLRRIKP